MELEQRSYKIFLESLKTDSTKQNYIYWLNRFLTWKTLKNPSIQNHDDLLKETQDHIQTSVEDYVMSMGTSSKSKYAVKISTYALFHFFAMNRVILNERLIKKLIPDHNEPPKRKTYSNDDIEAILKAIELTKIKKHKRWVYLKPRAKAIIQVLASSGVRLGGLIGLKFGDIERIEDSYSIKVYANTRYEYITFITPQASKYLDLYLATRSDLTPESKLFDLGYIATRQLISRLVIKAQVTTLTEVQRMDYFTNKRKTRIFKDIPIVHGFRSRFNTILKSNNEINKSMIESMIGHKPTIALDENYFKPTRDSLWNEYKKGIEQLTIKE